MKKQLYLPYYGFVALLACIAIYCEMNGYSQAFMILKPLTTITIIGAAFIFASHRHSSYRKMILLGLIFCLFGDTFLLNPEYFVYGLSSFLIAHLIFIFAFSIQDGFQFNLKTALTVFSVSIAVFIFLFNSLGEFLIPVCIYMLVISVMACQGINQWIMYSNTFGLVLAIASVLFLFSDSVIALDKFKYPFEWSRFWILSTYWLSISLIAYSTTFDNSETQE